VFTALIDPTAPATPEQRFFDLLAHSLELGTFVKLMLGKPRAGSDVPADLERLTVRQVTLKDTPHLSLLWRHRTRDVTKNLPLAAALAELRQWVPAKFAHAHLLTTTQDVQLSLGKKGTLGLRAGKRSGAEVAAATAAVNNGGEQAHDRERHRMVELNRPFLTALGVTTAEGQLVPAMARKWRQINKFIEVLDAAIARSSLATAPQVRVADFGSGKGYLTFAVHEHLQHRRGQQAQVTGVELRDDMVALCNGAVQQLGLQGLNFWQGDVRSVSPGPMDVMIALHACDIATDYAIHLGLRAGAQIILCSPCCHKEVRPQMSLPPVLKPMLQHGIHLGQQAEMVTDSLRALLLESQGYETQVFEFISLEHTSKNKMILAVKREVPDGDDDTEAKSAVRAQIAEIKAFYGIRQHSLETLLALPQPQPA
jgi:hypothetical protein